ncbi:DUF7490 domain-containing protein [Halomicrobium salinisoli]|uniref:DUF7490 domain-containing protein n=1 Tax=Halomicrobium salinisoli TaxID=2878391 RepID=UPI001CF08E09|nr:PGF-CTERM sorting domain-containing protein [Halomicrobium salinisoli]
MQRETAFAGGVVAVVVIMLLSAALVPGVVPEQDGEPDVRASHLDIREDDSTIRTAAVPGDTVVFGLDIRLRHRGGPAENVTVEVRAFDEETNLLATSQRVDAGTIKGDREVSVPVNLTVDREGGYRFETIVYENGTRVAQASQSIDGVDALTPDYSRSPIGFQRFDGGDGARTIAPRDPRVEDGRATLNVSTFLTNSGSASAGDVTLLVQARQADSNLIADETRRSVDSIRPGRSVQTNVELTVPDGYNYWLDAILFKDGVIIDTARGPAALDPPMNASEGTTDGGTEFEASDFEGDRVTDEPERDGGAEEETHTVSGEGPGFGLAAALAGLLAAALLIARNYD